MSSVALSDGWRETGGEGWGWEGGMGGRRGAWRAGWPGRRGRGTGIYTEGGSGKARVRRSASLYVAGETPRWTGHPNGRAGRRFGNRQRFSRAEICACPSVPSVPLPAHPSLPTVSGPNDPCPRIPFPRPRPPPTPPRDLCPPRLAISHHSRLNSKFIIQRDECERVHSVPSTPSPSRSAECMGVHPHGLRGTRDPRPRSQTGWPWLDGAMRACREQRWPSRDACERGRRALALGRALRVSIGDADN